MSLSSFWLSACQQNEVRLRVAVAANFSGTLAKIGRRFTSRTGTRIEASAASTGQLFAQIENGAPYDVFLAADTKRPRQLVRSGYAVNAARFVYACGTLVLWSRDPKAVDSGGEVLARHDLGVVAIADPRTAPYGAAARSLLEARGLWEPLSKSGRIATAASVTQAYQFVESGSAALGFVAMSQVLSGQGHGKAGSMWRVPTPPGALDQEAVLLTRAPNNRSAREFLDFLRGDPEARKIIKEDGYALP